jgi:hypothetical protein
LWKLVFVELFAAATGIDPAQSHDQRAGNGPPNTNA